MAAKETKEVEAKSFKAGDIVLTVELDGGKKEEISAGSFKYYSSFKGMKKVSGEDYYVKKAVALGLE